VADTHSGKAAARADVQAQTTGTHGRTLRHGPTEACQSSCEAAQLMMATRPGWLVWQARGINKRAAAALGDRGDRTLRVFSGQGIVDLKI